LAVPSKFQTPKFRISMGGALLPNVEGLLLMIRDTALDKSDGPDDPDQNGGKFHA
jgi:hypothetical protein